MARLWISSAILLTTLGATAMAQQPSWPGSKPSVPATTTQQTTTTTTTPTPRWPSSPHPRVESPSPRNWPTADGHERERRERERRARWEHERRERERREHEWKQAHRRHDNDRRPSGWSKGKKKGWGNCDLPPGQAKKHGCEAREWRHEGGRNHDRIADRHVPRWPGRR